jgi:hypothetical protein
LCHILQALSSAFISYGVVQHEEEFRVHSFSHLGQRVNTKPFLKEMLNWPCLRTYGKKKTL